jgi:glycosyltransferase 2 family protein
VNRRLQAILQITVSALLLTILVVIAVHKHVINQLGSVPRRFLFAAAGLMAANWLFNSVRWGLLLRAAGLKERWSYLASLYFIGMFFSCILPTGVGGDTVRIWDLARRRGNPAAVVVATLQDRLMGMGASMLLGLVSALIYLNKLPPSARPELVGIPIVSILAVAIFLYPRIPLAVGASLWRSLSHIGLIHRLSHTRLAHHVASALIKARELPPLGPIKLICVLIVSIFDVMLAIGVYAVLGAAAGIGLPYAAYCLVVPLVWIVALLPSLGGIGVREGAFVALMKLLSVPVSISLTVAASFLILQTVMAGLGGLLVLKRMLTGSWKTQCPITISSSS